MHLYNINAEIKHKIPAIKMEKRIDENLDIKKTTQQKIR